MSGVPMKNTPADLAVAQNAYDVIAATLRSSSRRRAHPEADLQRAVVALLRQAVPGAIVQHCANEITGSGAAARRRQAILTGMGVHAGFSDLVVLAQGRVLFLEVKSPRGQPTPAQRQFGLDVLAQGHLWAVVRSLDDALAACARAGIVTRVVAP